MMPAALRVFIGRLVEKMCGQRSQRVLCAPIRLWVSRVTCKYIQTQTVQAEHSIVPKLSRMLGRTSERHHALERASFTSAGRCPAL